MGILNPGKQNSKAESSKPAPAPKPDKSVFGGKSAIHSSSLKDHFRKASGAIPGGGGFYGLQERLKMADEITKKYGSYFEKGRFEDSRLFKDLRMERGRAKTLAEQQEIDKKIRFLRGEIEGRGK